MPGSKGLDPSSIGPAFLESEPWTFLVLASGGRSLPHRVDRQSMYALPDFYLLCSDGLCFPTTSALDTTNGASLAYADNNHQPTRSHVS